MYKSENEAQGIMFQFAYEKAWGALVLMMLAML